MFSYKDQFKGNRWSTILVSFFGSTELFYDVLRRSMHGQYGSVCLIEKVACIDFGPPQSSIGIDSGSVVVNRNRWGGRTFVTESSLRKCLVNFSAPTLIEIHLHH